MLCFVTIYFFFVEKHVNNVYYGYLICLISKDGKPKRKKKKKCKAQEIS